MIEIKMSDIITTELESGAIYNDEFEGFHDDYLVLHCLLRKYNTKSVFEIGTNCGKGTSIICNAVPNAKVYSLDLPTELAHISLQHPINEGHGDRVGHLCKFPFIQLRGDSMKFDFSEYPCEGYYIDGEHTEENVYHETMQVLNCDPKIVIYHDTNIQEVFNGLSKGIIEWQKLNTKCQINLYRITDTRISFLIKN